MPKTTTLQRIVLFVFTALLTLTFKAEPGSFGEPGNTLPDIRVIDDIQTANIYGSLAVQTVYFDNVLKRVTRTFTSSAGDQIVVIYDPSDRRWVQMKTPTSHYSVMKLNQNLYEIKDLVTGRYVRSNHTGSLPDMDINQFESSEPWFIALRNFLNYEASAQKSFNTLKSNAKSTSKNLCSSADDCGLVRAATTAAAAPVTATVCGGGVFMSMLTYGIGSSAAASACFLTALSALATVNDYMTDCVLCDAYEEIDDLSDAVTVSGMASEGSTYNPSADYTGTGGYGIRCYQRVWSVLGTYTYCALWDRW